MNSLIYTVYYFFFPHISFVQIFYVHTLHNNNWKYIFLCNFPFPFFLFYTPLMLQCLLGRVWISKGTKKHTQKKVVGWQQENEKKRGFSFSVIFFCWESFGNLAGCTTKWHTFFDKLFFEGSSKFSLRRQKYSSFRKYQFSFCVRYSFETFCNMRNTFSMTFNLWILGIFMNDSVNWKTWQPLVWCSIKF